MVEKSMRSELNTNNPPGQFSPMVRPLAQEVDEYFESKKKWAMACKLAASVDSRALEVEQSPRRYLEELLLTSLHTDKAVPYLKLVKLLEMLK